MIIKNQPQNNWTFDEPLLNLVQQKNSQVWLF
jgi:hypothetical protein